MSTLALGALHSVATCRIDDIAQGLPLAESGEIIQQQIGETFAVAIGDA